MKFELRDYQRESTASLLDTLNWTLNAAAERDQLSSMALAALTGAGKTVVAAAVIEAMLHGSSDLDIAPRGNLTFLWVTDDPALNRQTMGRLSQSSGLSDAELVEIDEGFDQHSLDAGRVYFLNIQKLTKSSRLAREGGDERRYSIWQTVENTVTGGATEVVLVLDEAHRGMKRTAREKSLVRHLIDGTRPEHVPSGNGDPHPVPVVWGISATPKRFIDTMGQDFDRSRQPITQVSNADIRASGLVKQKIKLANPDSAGIYDSSMLESATEDVLMLQGRWAAYAKEHGGKTVLPVLVVQVPDKASNARLKEIVETITAKWSLGPDAIVHVFGEHAPVELPGRTIHHHPPEQIEANTDIRVVLAKEAISTGWDCPRAEVLYSERPAKDETHIAQIIGRIVRTPLARHIEEDEALNRVYCYLPRFDEDAVGNVVKSLQEGDDAVAADIERATGTFDRVADKAVFELLESLRSLPKPAPSDNPVKRAKKLAGLLADDGIMADANATLTAALNGVLEKELTAREGEVDKAAEAVLTGTITMSEVDHLADVDGGPAQTERKTVTVSRRDLEASYRSAARRLKEGVAGDYHAHRRQRARQEGEDEMAEVKAQVTALLNLPGVAEKVETEADAWTDEALKTHRLKIRSSANTGNYQQIRAQSPQPVPTALALPKDLVEALEVVDKNDPAKRERIPMHEGHIYADEKGMFPAKLNGWETDVVKAESEREGFVGWYRNPSAAKASALRIAYQQGGAWKSLQPDFIVISQDGDKYQVSLLDPHGTHLRDAEPKLQALAAYAATEHGQVFFRIEALAELEEVMMVLDMTDPEVREAVLAEGADAEELYRDHGIKYT